MQIPLLLIGTGSDGPSGVPIFPSSIEEAYERFGGYKYVDVALSADSTGFTLPDAGAKELRFYTWKDGLLTSFTDISGVSVSGSDVTIERPGRDLNLVVRYVLDAQPDNNYVYSGYAEVASTSASTVVPTAVLRVGGVPASGIIGETGSQVRLESIYGGALYNSIRIVSDGNTIKIYQPAGKGDIRSYTVTGKTCEELASAINLDYMKGYSSVTASSVGSGEIIIPAGTYVMSGGEDGELSDEVLQELLETLDFQGVKVVSILGYRYRSDAADPDSMSGIITEDLLKYQTYPTVFVQGVAYDSEDQNLMASQYAAALVSAKSIDHASVVLVAGEGLFSYAQSQPYWNSMAVPYAAVLAGTNDGCIYKPVNIESVRPIFSEEDLRALKSGGYSAFTYSLSRGWVVFADSTSNPSWDSNRHLVYLAIVDVVYPILETVIGSRISEHRNLENELMEALESVPIIHSADVNVYSTGPTAINVEITAQPVGLVEAVKFGVSVNAASTR